MKRLSRVLFLSFASLTAVACGGKLGGLSIPGGKSAADVAEGGGSSAASAGADAATDSAADAADAARPVRPELLAYYKKLDHQALYPLLRNGSSNASYDQANGDLGRDPLWDSGNPDPAWIETWKSRDWSDARANAEALIQAGFNRSWEDACKAEFDASFASHRKLAADLGAELAAADGQRNHYARIAAYAALAEKFEKAAAAAGLDAKKDPFGPSGFRVTILQHAVAYHRGSPAAYTDFPWHRFGAVAEEARKEGRELSADAAFERQAYCAAAAKDGGLRVTPFIGKGSGAKDPTVWGDREQVASKVRGLVAAAGKALAVDGGIRIGTIDAIGAVGFHEREPRLALLSDATVSAVTRDGDGAKVTVTRRKLESFTFACKDTSTVEGVGDDGRVRYKQSCKSGDKIYTLTAQVTFAALPPGLALAKGDVVSFTADVAKDDSKKVTDTTSKVEWARELQLDGRLLVEAKRGSKPLPF